MDIRGTIGGPAHCGNGVWKAATNWIAIGVKNVVVSTAIPCSHERNCPMPRFTYALGPLVAMTAVMLGGCEKKVEMTNASAEDVAKAMKDQDGFKPGQWNASVEIVDVRLEGLPPKDAEMATVMAKAMKGKKQVSATCLTPEQAKKPVTDMFAGKDKGVCTYQKFSMVGGKMDAVMVCTPPGGGTGKMTLTLDGVYKADSYAVNVQMKGTDMPGSPLGASMTMFGKNNGTRTGDCKPGAGSAGKAGGKPDV